MSIKITGFDELENQFKQMEQGIKELDGTHQVPFSELFPSSFMKEYSSFASIDELLDAGGFQVETQTDFETIDQTQLDAHINSTTKFDNWENMIDEATSQYVAKKMGL